MTLTPLSDLREEMRGVASGQRPASPRQAAPLLAALSPESLDLLGILLRDRPATVTALAALAGRAQPNISRSLQSLAAHNLVRLTREGREVRPTPLATSVQINLQTGTYEATMVSAL